MVVLQRESGGKHFGFITAPCELAAFTYSSWIYGARLVSNFGHVYYQFHLYGINTSNLRNKGKVYKTYVLLREVYLDCYYLDYSVLKLA